MRVLVYTDSRGQHTPRGAEPHAVFAERLAQTKNLDTEVVLCPMKWTTTIDFLDYYAKNAHRNFDYVVLNTGIVDWSPRPQPSAINDLYDNKTPLNLNNEHLNTREYAKKVVNWKKPSFDAIFSEAHMRAHLAHDFGVEFEGKPTVNMYGLEMAETALLPRLAAIDNLIFINSNRFVPGWKGDHTRGRPENIAYTEKYSALFRDALGPRKTIDLLAWDDETIKRLTCDNIHYTKVGSDFLYEEILKRMGVGQVRANGYAPEAAAAAPVPAATPAPAEPFTAFGRTLLDPTRITPAAAAEARASAGRAPGEKLASLIIGVRFPDEDKSRVDNLEFLLSWIDHYYGDLFDVVLVEQDLVSRIDRIRHAMKPYVRHVFLFNPSAYNRGWGYNVAIKHHTDLPVVALMDTDVLTGANFLQEIIDCHKKYKAVSPYGNIYFTNAAEAAAVTKAKHTCGLKRANGVRKPTTIAGGVLIMNRDAYLSVGGFEQYTSYGGEDRALDVALMNRFPVAQIRIAPFVYAHMFHPSTEIVRENLDDVLGHLRENYGCTVDMTLTGADDIHKNCNHAPPAKTEAAIAARARSFGDPDLYASGAPLSVNGVTVSATAMPATATAEFPPAFESLDAYEKKELYDAPEPDSERIAGLYNKFRGKRCFIIGNGPSLNNHDLSLLEGEYVFAVNSFFYKTDQTGFRPTFYVVEDNMVMRENIDRIKKFEAPYKFFPTNYAALHPKGDNVYFFRMNRGFYEKSSPNYCTPRFSTDASDVLYCGQSVTFINLQLAYFLGFTEVYLIGMDFDYVIPENFKRNGDLIVSTADDPNHFHKDYFGVGKTWKDPKLDRVALNYKQAKVAYESVGRRIYNATVGGKLEIFDRVDYNALLRKPAASAEAAPRVLRPSTPRTGTGEPLISVVVPCYNVEGYLAQCLDTLLAQDDPNFEVVLVDDGSTDGTPAVIADYCARHPTFASVWRPNGGLGAARNTGTEFAKGDFILYVDSDDYVLPTAISALRRKQKEGNHDIVTGRFVRVSENGVVQDVKTDALPQHEIPKGCPPLSRALKVLGAFAPSVAWARLYRTSLLRDHQLSFPGRAPHEDLYFTYKAFTFAKSAAEITDEIYFYRQREGSISKAISKAHVDTLFEQWLDADDFIAKTGAPPLARALAARRTLILLEGFRKRAAADPKQRDYLKAELTKRRVGMHTLLAEFRNSKVAESYVPQIAIKLVESLPIDTKIDPAFEPTNVIYPFDKINFDAYRPREIGTATAEDRHALSRFHNAFKGKRCFIIGNGPSLNKHDLSLLKGEYTFAVNSFFYKTEEAGFTPTFFVVEDNLVMRENIDRIKAYDVPFKFFPAEYKEHHPEGPNVFFYPTNWGFYLQSSPNYCVPRFSTDATKGVFAGQTVTFANLQLAYFMGFTEVYLIGMDFHYVVPDAHGRKGNWILSTTDDPNHFHKDYFGAGKTWKDPKLDRVANAYRQARLAFEATGRVVKNASVEGKLELFDRVPYESLFITRPVGAAAASSSFRVEANGPKVAAAAPSLLTIEPTLESASITALASLPPASPPTERPSPNPANAARLTIEPALDAASGVALPPPPPATPQFRAPFYAPFGNWLRIKSPGAFAILKLARRAAAGLWRRRAVTLPALLLLAALPVAAFSPGFETQRWLFLGAGAFLIAMAAILYVALRMYKFVFDANAEIKRLAERIADLQQANALLGESAGGRAETIEAGVVRLRAEIDKRLAALKSETGMRVVEIDARIAALRGDVDQRAVASGDRLDDAFARLEAEAEERRAMLDAAAAHIDALKAALDQRGDALAGQIEALAQAQDTAMSGLQAEASLRAAETEERIAALAKDIGQHAQAIGEELNSTITSVRAELDGRNNALGGDLDALALRVSAHRSEAEDERDALHSVLETRIGELRERANALQAEAERAQAALAEDVAARTAALEAALAAMREGLSARIGAAIARIHAADTASAQSLAALRGELTGKVDAAQLELERLEAAAQDRVSRLREELANQISAARAEMQKLETAAKERDGALRTELAGKVNAAQAELKALEAAANEREAALAGQLGATLAELKTQEAAAKERDAALRTEIANQISAAQAEVQKLQTAAKEGEASLRGDVKAEIQNAQKAVLTTTKAEIAKERADMMRLRERLATSERQISAMRFPGAPSTLVFFGHHKCASRFFRLEVFSLIAEATGARTRRYEIAHPPFHYSRMDELDLCNINFDGLGKKGRDVVWFANATARSLDKIQRATQDWKGLRVIRDPRQVLVSSYFHHKGDHPDVSPLGWVWDQLVRDKAILRELPEEDGLLHELDSISRQVIEEQVLAPFDDPRIMTIRIEDFTEDPQAHLRHVSEFLGVADIAGIDFSKTAANPTSGPWRRHFTSKLREVFKERYGQALIDLGYAEDLLW